MKKKKGNGSLKKGIRKATKLFIYFQYSFGGC